MLSKRSYKIHVVILIGSSWNTPGSLAWLSFETNLVHKLVGITSLEQGCTK